MPTSRRKKKSQINSLTLHLKELEKEQQAKPKVSRRKEITKNRVEVNEIQTKKTTEKVNEIKGWFFKKINKINKPSARLTKKKIEKAQLNKIRNEREVTTEITEIQRVIRNYYKQFHAKKLNNLEEMDKFLKPYNLLTLNPEEIENLNRTIYKEIEIVIKKLLTNKSPGPDGFTGKFYRAFKEFIPILLKLFQKIKRRENPFKHILQSQPYPDTKNEIRT